MTEIVIERPDVTYEITVDDSTYVIDGRFIYTGSDQISDVTGLQDALDLKLDAADYNDRFLGLFASVFDLEAAHPTANAGDYAQVDLGIGSDVIIYAWDVSDQYWSAVGSSAIANTDALPEGSSNLYHTGQRVRDTPLTGLSLATATPITAADSVLSAAGKLQAQISAASGGSAYIAGRYYSQALTAAPPPSAISRADGVAFFIPFLPQSDLNITRFGFSPTTAANSGATLKAAIYEAGGVNLARMTDSLEIAAATAVRHFFDQFFEFKAGRLYFIGFKTSEGRTFTAISQNAAPTIGSVGGAALSSTLQVTFLQLTSQVYALDMPELVDSTTLVEASTAPAAIAFLAG